MFREKRISAQNRASHVLLPQSLQAMDQRIIDAGLPPLALMDRAADAVLRVIRGRYSPRPVSVVCGPGQNGGDGWAIAWMLQRAGWDVTVNAAVPIGRLDGAAFEAATRADMQAALLADVDVGHGRLIVDALFGAGLSRDLVGVALETVQRMRDGEATVLAVDLPSGIDGNTGQVRGAAVTADATVTFHACKPGHLLQPGADHLGDLFVADIGLSASDALDPPDALRAGPRLFALPMANAGTHKYKRGSVIVVSGGHTSASAARLSARAAATAGAGAVTLATPMSALDVNAGAVDAVMVKQLGEPAAFAQLVAERSAAAVLGPGMGRTDATRDRVVQILNLQTPCVLDADALTVFEDTPETLFALAHDRVVLTPHEGEFARLFGQNSAAEGKLVRTRNAAERAGCTILLKGADTVIASPGKTPVICDHGPPWLATAGSGDSLAGLIGALLSQGMIAHEAAAMGAWLHAEAGRIGGPGLTADDLSALIGQAYARVLTG